MDIKAKLAEIRAKRELEKQNEEVKKEEVSAPTVPVPANIQVPEAGINNVEEVQTKLSTLSTVAIGTARTSEIDHLSFMSQMQELADAILHQHPKMPVLLMQIHKHLRADPELVTTLSEEEIGVIVNGLKVQTITELVGTINKAPSSRSKKITLSTDMF